MINLMARGAAGLFRWYWGLDLIAKFFVAMVAIPLLSMALAKTEGGAGIVSLIAIGLVAMMVASGFAHGAGGRRR